MDSDSLQTFVSLAQTLNFSRTADALFVAQSTVTKRVAELEHEIGKKLFHRSKRQVSLTEEGAAFLPYATRILALESASIKEVNSLLQYERHLRVGATNSIYECYLFPLVSHYHASPSCAIQVKIGHSFDLLQQMQDDILDVVFSSVPFRKSGYACLDYRAEPLVLVTGIQNTEYRDGIRKSQLTEINYLMCDFALSEVGLYIRQLFPKHFPFGLEIDNSTKLIPYLLAGQGCSFLPKSMIEEPLTQEDLRIIPLLDFNSPFIKTYCVGKEAKKDLWESFLSVEEPPRKPAARDRTDPRSTRHG